MKQLASIEKEIGADGGKIKGSVGVNGDQLELSGTVSYPISKIVEPVMGVVDSVIDKLEKLIPGDQSAMAAALKAEARADVVKALSEQP